MWARGRELCKQRGSRHGGRDSSVSQALESQDFSTSKSGVTWCAHWQCLLSPTVCRARHHIPAHSTATLLTLGKFTDVPSLGSNGIKACRIRILDIRSDSQFLMSWCACRVSVSAGGRSGRTRFNLWKEMSQSGELSWVKISHTTGVHQVPVQLSLYCTLYTA